ncbi:unnamed protein product, partial [Mesorhabditis belari]|uniref:WD repeat domain phosphoinositide-interacting protein 4 n=1 Tax=Mesorhabditis belari TaxID=2138241 RepID=A0AAF3J8N5_9BILA
MRSIKINSVGINADQDIFSVATDSGIRLFNVNPLALLSSVSKDLVGSVGFCTILHRSNLIIFSGAPGSKFPSNTVFVWDDKAKELVLEIAVPGGAILNILASYTHLIVVQARKLHIFQFPNPCKLLRSEEVGLSQKTICALSADVTFPCLAFSGFKIGSVQIMRLDKVSSTLSQHSKTVDAHQNEIAHMAMNKQGMLLATGSIKGTVIRIFDTRTCAPMWEFRRGTDPAGLHCIQFSPCSTFLAVSSDKGTIHIFSCRDSKSNVGSTKKNLLQQFMPSEQRSIAQISLEPRVLTLAFVPGSSTRIQSIVALCAGGTYHRFSFGLDGHTNREGFDYFMQLGDEEEFWTQPL